MERIKKGNWFLWFCFFCFIYFLFFYFFIFYFYYLFFLYDLFIVVAVFADRSIVAARARILSNNLVESSCYRNTLTISHISFVKIAKRAWFILGVLDQFGNIPRNFIANGSVLHPWTHRQSKNSAQLSIQTFSWFCIGCIIRLVQHCKIRLEECNHVGLLLGW